MGTQANHGPEALTEKEKQTLRMMVRGHDAKSIAASLDLSVHTINGRLRDARRKMAATSSREAARQLLEAEGGLASRPPENLVGKEIGGDPRIEQVDQGAAPIGGARHGLSRPWIITGVLLMTLALALAALTILPHGPSPLAQTPTTESPATNPEVVDIARHWLELVDEGQWKESYQATGASFQRLNTEAAWAKASEQIRPPLGVVISRTFASHEDVPAPPHGYEVVRFHTKFANRADEAVETVSLDRENGEWRVTGV
ncbi:helix-turn-helix domain-containing protein [Stakelama marina]|uniref:DUF4019 domain-containing protein n=1 Tax=Stakelama marina TaxID=2826939 RepID=A0A8T4ICC9_9SPHN|nr:DUF4019 domain-containing protein [Stakelama marina]MBR0552220.1 DUF4019 domain-containing protein [Stakelama marina]